MGISQPGRACLVGQPDPLGCHLDPDPVFAVGQSQHPLHLQAAEARGEARAAEPDPGTRHQPRR